MKKSADTARPASSAQTGQVTPDEMHQAAIDALVAACYAGEDAPEAALEFINDWVSVDGWDDLLSASPEEFLVPLLEIGQFRLTDDECRAHFEFPARKRLTKAFRLQFARNVLAEIQPDDNCPTLALLPITASDGRKAVLGGLICVEGQGGAVPYLDGAYASSDEVMTSARERHLIPWGEHTKVSDEVLLAVWNGGGKVR